MLVFPDGTTHHEYLKVHGSVNWWMVNNKLTYLSFGVPGGLAQKWSEYAQGRNPT